MREETAPEAGFYSVVSGGWLTLVVRGVRLSAEPKRSCLRFLSVFFDSRWVEAFEAERRFWETCNPYVFKSLNTYTFNLSSTRHLLTLDCFPITRLKIDPYGNMVPLLSEYISLFLNGEVFTLFLVS